MVRSKRNKKNNTLKKIIIIIMLLAIILFVSKTISKYETTSSSNGNMNIAFYLINADYQSIPLVLSELEPSEEPYIYNFTVSNYNGSQRLETSLEYNLSIKATTNLPLTFDLYKNEEYDDDNAESAMLNNLVEADEDGTFFRTITTETEEFGFASNQENEYQLVIYFPEEYKTIDYQDIIEMIEISVDSKQKIS